MPINVNTTYKLNAKSKKVLVTYLKGDATMDKTAEKLKISRQRVYTMSTAIFRHAIATNKIDVKAVLKDY